MIFSKNYSHKHSISRIITSCLIALISFLSIFLMIRFIWHKAQPTTYIIPAKTCIALFGETPKEFSKNPNDWATWTQNFCAEAKVDNFGNLVLKLSDKQKKEWRSQYNYDIENAKKIDGVYISDDYTKISVAETSETAMEQLTAVGLAFKGCFVNQLLNGMDPTTMHIDFTLTNAQTGEIICQANWPDEEINSYYEFETSTQKQN